MYETREEITAKRLATIAARRADRGCDCHHLPMTQCPNYAPKVWGRPKPVFPFKLKDMKTGEILNRRYY